MAERLESPRVAIQVSRGVVVASIQADLDDDVLHHLREDLLTKLQATGSEGVILDVSGLEMLDPEELAALRRIITMTALMGARTVLSGLRPGVVSALVEADADVDGLLAAIDVDAAFALLEPEPERAGDATEDGDEADPERLEDRAAGLEPEPADGLEP